MMKLKLTIVAYKSGIIVLFQVKIRTTLKRFHNGGMIFETLKRGVNEKKCKKLKIVFILQIVVIVEKERKS